MSSKLVLFGDMSISSDDLELCKMAHAEGAEIERIDEWRWSSNSGKTDYYSKTVEQQARIKAPKMDGKKRVQGKALLRMVR